MITLRALIYIGGVVDRDVATRRCLAHCEQRGYQVVSLVEETDGGHDRWAGAIAALGARLADVLVMAHPDEVPHDQLPRLEIAGHGAGGRGQSTQRRPRRKDVSPDTGPGTR